MAHKLLLGILLPAALLAALLGMALAQGPAGQTLPVAPIPEDDFSHLDRAITTTHFIIHYTLLVPPAHPNDFLNSDNEAQEVSDILEHVYDVYVNDPNYGFNHPLGSEPAAAPLDVYVVDIADACGVACWGTPPRDYFKLDAGCIRSRYNPADQSDLQSTPLHELFHRVQYTYDRAAEETWSFEGSATTMQDKIYGGANSLDDDPGSKYVERANMYLNSPNRVNHDNYGATIDGLRTASYYAGLFWTYYMQRCGSVAAEPELGMDALLLYWEQTLLHDNVDAMDHAIQASPGCPELDSMEDLFHDFVVTNYTKQLGGVGDDYRYTDEQGPQGTLYDDVFVEHGVEGISPGVPLTHSNEQIAAWGANYYVGRPTPACTWVQVELDGDPGDYLLYTILTVDGAGNAYGYDQARLRRRGENLTRTFYNNNLDQVVAIVGAPDASATYDVEMRCVDPDIHILQPESVPFEALVGDPAQPGRFLLRLSVTAGGGFVEGLADDAFAVRVEGAVEDAQVISSAYVQDEYWLVVQAPIHSAAGLYDLQVTLVDSGLVTTEVYAVRYDATPHVDEIILLDRSGSMDDPPGPPFKIDAARNAAVLYVDEAPDGDQLGVISFEGTPSDPPDHQLDLVDDAARDHAQAAIRAVTAGGGTSIGAALSAAVDEFTARGDADKPDVIILLSDGMETLPPYYDDVRDVVMTSGVVVHTVALGPDADQDLMQRIQDDTEGEYLYAAITDFASQPALPRPAGCDAPEALPERRRAQCTPDTPDLPAGPDQITSWLLGVSNIYDYLEGQVEGRARVQSTQLSAQLFIPISTTVVLDASISHATFAVAHNAAGSQMPRSVWLVTPGGTTIDPGTLPPGAVYRSDASHNVYEIPSPQPGNWQVWLQYNPSVTPPPGPYDALVAVSGQSSTLLAVYVATPLDLRLTGGPVALLVAFFGPDGLLPGATMTAQVDTGAARLALTLRDDGQHADGEAGDGIYGAFFTRATAQGSFTLHVEGQQGSVLRQAMASFAVEADLDSDGDGMPDGWENRYGLNPAENDATGDPDWDYRNNLAEYGMGTNPQDDDTDDGGMADDSEWAAGSDPVNNPDDDIIDRPTGARAAPGNGQVVIRYDRQAGYADVNLYWSTDPAMGDWQSHLVTIGTAGVYTHTGLTNGTPYYYRLAARTANYRYSAYTDRFTATPQTDPYPPAGTVAINDGAPIAYALDAVLQIQAADDGSDEDGRDGPNTAPPAEMRVSRDPFFTGVAWEPYTTTRSWQLQGLWGELDRVYVQFRDAAGNQSGLAVDGIRLAYRIYLPLIQK